MKTRNDASVSAAAREKQVLLECLLQDPRLSWLHSRDGRRDLRVRILLQLGKLSLIRKSMRRV